MPRTAQSAMLHLIEGNPNNKTKKELHKRIKNEQEMAVSAKNMKAPEWLSTGAKKEFKRIVELFKGTSFCVRVQIFQEKSFRTPRFLD